MVRRGPARERPVRLLVRGAVWIGIYAALALAPLLVALLADPVPERRPYAVELGVACGLVAFSLIALELALVARIRAASDPFGTDVLMQLHRLAAVIALGFLVAHPLLLWRAGIVRASMFDPVSGPSAWRSGALAFWGCVALAATSLWRRRLRLPYELWRLVHRLLALVVVAAVLAHALGTGAYARSAAVSAAYWALAGLFLALAAWYLVVRPLALLRRPWEVAENRDEGADTRALVVRPVGHGGIAFEPGQFAWLTTGATPFHPQQHPISIASSAERAPDGRLEFAIKALGDWSRATVPSLAKGARVWIDGPFGAFTPDRVPAQGFVLIAGGIGIGPMRSMLLTLRDRGDPRPVLLVYAARNPSRTVFATELAELERAMPLRVVYVFEEPEPGWRGERGFVTEDVLRRHVPADPAHLQFFVCGPPPMLTALERALTALAVPQDRIHTERFDMG